ncbi:MAG: type II secretion system protein [Betaproteobacteria bacterium]|nr:type II secretion system protein [Betaproteobacteria bacterium]
MAPPPSRPAREAGFTIVEVLAAFVVFGLALAGIMQLFTRGLTDAQLADEYARAVMIAQSRLAAFTAVELVEERNAEGTEDRYRWRVTAAAYDERRETPNADASRDLNLRVRLIRVDSVVAWTAADGRARDVRLATLVLAAKP